MTPHRIRLGIIGTGIAARELHWPALARMSELYEIAAVCNHNVEKARKFAQLVGGDPTVTDDYRHVLELSDIDAVDLTLPIALNANVTREALAAGKHVIVEKPIAASVESGRAVVGDASAHPELVMLVAENVRYERRFRLARARLDGGAIGRVVMIHADVLQAVDLSNPYAQTNWRRNPEHLGGFMSDGGVHQTAALHVLGGKVDSVQAITAAFDRSGDVPDTVIMNLQFSSGVAGHLTYSVGVFAEEPAQFRVFGTEGTLTVHSDRIQIVTEDGVEDVTVESQPNAFELEFRDFYEAIVTGKQTDVTPADGLADLQVVDAALRSSRSGETTLI